MSIVSKALSFLKGDDDDVTKIIEAEHQLIERAQERERKITILALKCDRAEHDYILAAGNAESPDDKDLIERKTAFDDLTKQVAFLETALRGDAAELEEVRVQRHKIGRETYLRRFKNLTAKRAEKAEELAAAAQAYVLAILAFSDTSARIQNASLIGVLGSGTVTTVDEVNILLAQELTRLNPIDVLQKRGFRIPGQILSGFIDPRRFKPLVEETKLANDYVMRLIDERPISGQAVAPTPAPATIVEPAAANTAPEKPAGKSAAELMSVMGGKRTLRDDFAAIKTAIASAAPVLSAKQAQDELKDPDGLDDPDDGWTANAAAVLQ
jgi:hypothetical protein